MVIYKMIAVSQTSYKNIQENLSEQTIGYILQGNGLTRFYFNDQFRHLIIVLFNSLKKFIRHTLNCFDNAHYEQLKVDFVDDLNMYQVI